MHIFHAARGVALLLAYTLAISRAEGLRAAGKPRPTTAASLTAQKEQSGWPMPEKMRFCDLTRCGTFTSTNGRYNAVYDDRSPSSFYAIGEVTSTSITLHRVEQNGRTAVLTGKLSLRGDRVVDGVETWEDGQKSPFNLAWGGAIGGVVPPRASRSKP